MYINQIISRKYIATLFFKAMYGARTSDFLTIPSHVQGQQHVASFRGTASFKKSRVEGVQQTQEYHGLPLWSRVTTCTVARA